MGLISPLASREARTAESSRDSTRIIKMGWTMEMSSSPTVFWALARRITVPSDRRWVTYMVCSDRVEEKRWAVPVSEARASRISSRSPWFSMSAASTWLS